MESDRISTIEDWSTLDSVRDVEVLLRFPNIHQRFIRKYAKLTAPISNLLKTNGSRKWEWTWDAEHAFGKLKKVLTDAPILQHINPQKAIILQTNASGFPITSILSLYDWLGILQPVNVFSRKCAPGKQIYNIYDRELLAIVKRIHQWRQYHEGANHIILIQCDHKNLQDFQTSKVLFRTQAKWAEIISFYNFIIEYLKGKNNPANGPLRRPDYKIS